MATNEFVKLTNRLQIKYLDNVVIAGSNMYKYNALLDNKVHTFYTQINIDVENDNKEKVSNCIIRKLKENPNDDNLFIDLTEFDISNNDASATPDTNTSVGNSSSTNVRTGALNSNNNLGYSITSYDKFDEAIQTISNMSCPSVNLKQLLDDSDILSKDYKYYSSELENIAMHTQSYFGNMQVEEFVTEFKTGYSEIFNEVANAIITDLELKARNTELQLPVETIMAGYSATDFNNEVISLCENIKNGSIAISTLSQITSALNDVRGKYFYSSKETNMDILEASTLTEEDLRDLNMTGEEKKVYLENIKQKNESLYLLLNQVTNISREEFDDFLNSNPEKLAKMMEEISIESSKGFNSGENDNSYNALLYEMMNDYYSSEVGQKKLLNQFVEESGSKYDEYEAIGKSKYIEYCISLNHSQDWLLEELKPYAAILDRINWDNNFCDFEVIKDNSTLDYISKWQTGLNDLNGVSDKKILPYGIVYVDGEYKQRVYNQFGENMLQYLDYHMGENIGNTGSKMIVTAFSAQGLIDAVERDYKGRWVENHTETVHGSNLSEDARKHVKENARKKAEEDYYILNGVINNKERYDELINSGEVSFKDVYAYTNITGNTVAEILNKEYLESNKENIREFSDILKQQEKNSEDQLYNFNVENDIEIGDGFGSNAIEFSVGAIASFMASIGVTGVEIGTGVAKHLEGWYDAANIALNSDLALFTKGSADGNITIDLAQLSKLSKEVQSFRNEVWNDFSKTDLYKMQFDTYKNDGTADVAVKAYYDKYLYDPLTGTYKALDGKKYYSYEDIPLSVKEQLIPSLFKENKMNEWSLNDSSSSNIYVAAYKEAIRNGGDFTRFDSLSDKIKENASEQFEAMEEVSKDHVTEYTEKNIFENESFKDLEKLSVIKHDNIFGMTANQIGNMAIPVLASAVVPGFGQALSSGLLFTSAFGGAAEEAIKSGGSYNEALNYATLSATTEILIEKVFSGVAGYGEGWFDDVLEGAANKMINGADFIINKTIEMDKNLLKNSVLSQTIKEVVLNGAGEGAEEVVTDLVTPLWQSLTYLNEKSYSEIVSENVSLESLSQTFLVSFLSSMVFGAGEINQKTQNFNKQLKGLEQIVGEIPGFKAQANKVLAEIIGYDAYENGITKTDIINEIINRNATELVNNLDVQNKLKELQNKIVKANNELSNSYVSLKVGTEEIKIPKSVVINVTDMLGIVDGYNVYDGKLIFKNLELQDAFISGIYDNAINQLKGELVGSVINKMNLESKINDLSFAIKTISESLNPVSDVENVIIEVNGNDITIPKNVVEEIISNPNIDENSRLILDEEVSVDDFITGLKEHARVVAENGINSNLYSDKNEYTQQMKEANDKIIKSREEIQVLNEALSNKNYSEIGKAVNLIKDNSLVTTSKVIVTDSSKVKNQDLVKLEVQAVVDGKQKQVNIFVDSTSDDIVFNKDNKMADKIHEIIEQNKDSENVYVGEVKYDVEQKEVSVTQNDANKAFVYYLNTGVIASTTRASSNVKSTVSSTKRKNSTTKVDTKKAVVQEEITSDNVQNIIDMSKINIAFDNFRRQMNSFIKNIKEECQKVVNSKSISKQIFEQFKLEQQQKFNDRINVHLEQINGIKNNSLDIIDNLLVNLNDKSSLKEFYEEQRKKLIDLFQDKSSKFIDESKINFEQVINPIELLPRDLIVDASTETSAKSSNMTHYTVKDTDSKIETTENEKQDIKVDSDIFVDVSDEVVNDIEHFNEAYSSIPTTTLLDFIKQDIKDIGKVFIDKESFDGYSSDILIKAVVELYNYAKENEININIKPNLEHYIKESQSIKVGKGNILLNVENALYKGESIISIPTMIQVPSYSRIGVVDLFNVINGQKDISETYFSEIDLYYATRKVIKYFEGKNITVSQKTKLAFDIVKSVDNNSTIINFIDVLNGKNKIVLPSLIEGRFDACQISSVMDYLNGEINFIGIDVIESLKEYIDTNNIYIPSEMMDKINLLSTLGEDKLLLNEEEYLKGKNSPIVVPKHLDGIYRDTSTIYGWITGEKKYHIKHEEVINFTKKFAEYIYSNNIKLDKNTKSKLDVLFDLKSNETILNLDDFFKGSKEIIANNTISMNGNNFKTSTILDVINLTSDTYLKILSGQSIDGITRGNIFDVIDVLYYINPKLREITLENYEKIKTIYNDNYILEGKHVLPKTFNDISCEFIETILNQPTLIRECTSEERTQIINAINEYIDYLVKKNGYYNIYNPRVKMRDNLVDLISREIPKVNIFEEIHSPLYYMFQSNSENGGTFGANQSVIANMLSNLSITDSIKLLFRNSQIPDNKFLKFLGHTDITKIKLENKINYLFNKTPNMMSVNNLIKFISNNETIKLVQKNFPGMTGTEALRFLYLVETKEAGNTGVCNYATAVNMIFNRYLGKESSFKSDFGYPMYVINEQGNKVLNDKMLLVDMYSTINKGVLVKKVDGKYEINTSNSGYLNLSDIGRFKMEYLQKFIDAKGIDLGLKETFNYSSYDGHVMWKEELILKIKEALEKGEYINVSGAGFDLLYKDGSVAVENCGGHIMTLVGLTPDGKLIVDSWGIELLIDLESTMEHLGEEIIIDGGTFTRRLAVTTYELTGANTNIEDHTNQNNVLNQDLEVFDTVKEIDMIDESSSNIENMQQVGNVKKLSILDNIKHTLQRINDRFTGYKTSKLNTESYYDKVTKYNDKLFKQKQINKTFRDFANKYLINLETLKNNELLKNPKLNEINPLLANGNRILTLDMDLENISIADIIGVNKQIDLDKNFNFLFNENGSEFQTRSLGLLKYSNEEIINALRESFKNHPLVISEVDDAKYIVEDNGYHRYSVLRLHYLSEYIKVKDNSELLSELNKKYTIPVSVYKLDYLKTYCTSILKEAGINIKVKTNSVTKKSKIIIDGKVVTMNDSEFVQYTKNLLIEKIQNESEFINVINNLLIESDTFRGFYNKYLNEEIIFDKKKSKSLDSIITSKHIEAKAVSDMSLKNSKITRPSTQKEVEKKYGKYSVSKFIEISKNSEKFKTLIESNQIELINKIKGIINDLYPNPKYDTKIYKLKEIFNLIDGNTLLNIDEVINNYSRPLTINNDVLIKYNELNKYNDISLKTLYEIISNASDIYSLISDKVYNNISISNIIESYELLLDIAKKEGYTDNIINEIDKVLNVLKSNLEIDAKYDEISNIHVESNTPKGYYLFEDLYKENKNTRKVVNILEEKGYKTEEISEIILHKALRGKNQLVAKAYYYRAFNYLNENGYNEQEAASLISDMYQKILDLRGTRVIHTTPSGISIRIINNYKGKNQLVTIDNISTLLNQASKYYFKTDLNEIIIYDSFSPRNIYCEKVQYSDFVKKHGIRAVVAATATNARIDLWEDLSSIDTIIHEYAHTIDKHITKFYGYRNMFSNSSEWINAIVKDKRITSRLVSEYASANNQEDFAEFIKEFNKNSLEVAVKYPNRYKVASKYLNMEIDSKLIKEYIDGPIFIESVVELSPLLTDDGKLLEFVKQYIFEDNAQFNTISKIVVEELNSMYESKKEILEDLNAFGYEVLELIRLSEKRTFNKFLKIIKEYLEGKDISTNINDLRNLKLIEMLGKEDIIEWYDKYSDVRDKLETLIIDENDFVNVSNKSYDTNASLIDLFKKNNTDLELFKETLLSNKLSTLSDSELSILIDYIKKGKIKLKDYNLNSETIGILIDKVPLQKIYPLSNVKAVKTFIEYFGKDTLVEFDKANNNFLLGNNGENLYSLFDYYDLSIPKTNETDKLNELNNLITNVINTNKKTEYKTYTFNYSGLINSEYSKIHPEFFLDESAPQDLKDAFYNGIVNSSNEYKTEWSKYLEGKSIKGVMHETLISFEDVKVVENINVLGDSSSKYKVSLQELSNRVGITVEEIQKILSTKMKELIGNSEFGVRRTLKSLESILESGKIKNQFEANRTSYGVDNTDMRMDMEKELFGIPRNIKYEDRPIYGMLLPKDMSSKYVTKGPGSYYSEGSGVIYIFDKTKIINNATLTLGDSLDQAGKVCATNLSNPKFFGMFNEMLSTIKNKEDLLNFDFTSLYEKSIMEVGNAAYYEFQLHGEESHALNNLKEIVFLKMPEAKIIEKLKELNISFRVIK